MKDFLEETCVKALVLGAPNRDIANGFAMALADSLLVKMPLPPNLWVKSDPNRHDAP